MSEQDDKKRDDEDKADQGNIDKGGRAEDQPDRQHFKVLAKAT